WSEIAEVAKLLEPLNPYDKSVIPGSILEIEHENFDAGTNRQRKIECFAIAAKRYALFARDAEGRPELVGKAEKRRRAEHGLGPLLLPTDPELGAGPALDEWWTHLLCTELGVPNPEPGWFAEEAIGRLTVTSRHEEQAFRAYNAGRPYAEGVRPWNFL